MELPGSNYLLTLAAVSITFAGFSTIAIVFRQAQGVGLSEYETVFVRLFVASGLIATVFSLIPPLLELFGITASSVWRVSSLAFALVLVWRLVYWMRLRLHLRSRRLPRITVFLSALFIVLILGLFVNAIGILIEPNVGLYALGVTWLLVNAILGFILMLSSFLQPPKKG